MLMASATSAGAKVQCPLVSVIICCLITSTLLKLLILPTFYGWFVREGAEKSAHSRQRRWLDERDRLEGGRTNYLDL